MATLNKAGFRSECNSSKLSNKMAARNQEVRPVGAWAQPATQFVHDATVSAVREEARLHQLQAEKEARLQNFQDEVRRRVHAMNRLKRLQQMDKSFKAVLDEQNVISQSSIAAAEKSSLKKYCCTVRPEMDLSIRQGSSGLDNAATSEQFQEQTKQVHDLHNRARKSLGLKQILSEDFERGDLPGGVWRTGATLDHPISRKFNEEHGFDSGKTTAEDDSEKVADTVRPAVVRFDLEPPNGTSRKQRISRKSAMNMSGTEIDRVPHVPNIHPGVQTEEQRVRLQQQRAIYRRLFMDIEREQVKENLRQKDHRKRMASLKQVKECERMELEEQFSMEPVDSVTGQTLEETEAMLEMMEKEVSQFSLEEQDKNKQRKSKEMERFLNALKRNLKEKIEKQHTDLPQLCSCGPTVWDTSPETCANNCVFYRNPKGYARALQSLLASCDTAAM